MYDDRYGYPGEFELLRCDDCRHAWLSWTPAAATLETLYTDYYPRSSRPTEDFAPLRLANGLAAWWRGQRATAAFWVPPNVRVLDIGCGFGESLAYHRARGCDVVGVEADRNIARVAQRYGFDVRVGLFDPSEHAGASFDYVTMDQVLEHVTDPFETLQGIKQVLKPQGRLVVSTPNASSLSARLFGRRWINWHAPYHLHFFSPASIELLSRRAGFEVESVQTTTSSEWINYQLIHLLTRPKQGERSRFWTDRAKRTARERVLIGALRGVHRLGFDHLATRVLDSLELGDNYIIMLKRREGPSEA